MRPMGQRASRPPGTSCRAGAVLASAELVAFVASADLAASGAFYESVLGLPLVEATSFANVHRSRATTLRVTRADAVAAAPYTVLGWTVPDIEGAVTSLRAAGVVFARHGGMAQDAFDAWTAPSGARVAWFADPDANTLSLTQPPGG